MSSTESTNNGHGDEQPKIAPREFGTDATPEMDHAVEHARRRYVRNGGWRSTAIFAAVAVGAFAVGTYWGSDALRMAGISSHRHDEGPSVAASGPSSAPVIGANHDAGDGGKSLWTC
ncbi:MAG TPA: hypothetical protein VGN72_23930 [Tepidisphaeraceae bacterium]|jgi:hypothetical protein|nr:hypothetical protein [Tepidisphaeraceae bacterium]